MGWEKGWLQAFYQNKPLCLFLLEFPHYHEKFGFPLSPELEILELYKKQSWKGKDDQRVRNACYLPYPLTSSDHRFLSPIKAFAHRHSRVNMPQ